MIKSLQLGIHRKMPALIELMNDKIVLLELVQTSPRYKHELRSFDTKGHILEFSTKEEIIPKDRPIYYKTLEFEVYECQELIRTSGKLADKVVKDLIVTAYGRSDEFYDLLMNLQPSRKDEALKKKLEPMLKMIVDYDYKRILNYNIGPK